MKTYLKNKLKTKGGLYSCSRGLEALNLILNIAKATSSAFCCFALEMNKLYFKGKI
jgi:hypothetical protein